MFHIGASFVSLAPIFYKSQSALILLLLLSKSQPLALGCDLVCRLTDGFDRPASFSSTHDTTKDTTWSCPLLWVPAAFGGLRPFDLTCSGQINCPCAKVLAFGQNACSGAKAPPARRPVFISLKISRLIRHFNPVSLDCQGIRDFYYPVMLQISSASVGLQFSI